MLGHLLLISALLGLVSPLIRTGLATQWSEFSNSVITTNIRNVADNVRSGLRCVMLCLEDPACVSVFYRQVSTRCQFHDVLFLSPQDGEDENGTKYYSVTTGSCPQGYIHARHLGLCYQVHLTWIVYDESTADCASRNEHLIVIDSQEKQDHIRKQLSSSSEAKSRNYWIDGSDAETEGQWIYHDERPVTFFAWAEGWPMNTTLHWSYLVASRGNFLWQDRRKGERHYRLCQKDT